jgi:dTDP-4-dehydrorhamnose reductase
MKVFLFGANGMLGNYVQNYLTQNNIQVIPLTRKDFDLEELSVLSLKKFLEEKALGADDVIINCAGVIPQASKDHELSKRNYYKINSILPIILSMLTTNMIHITTDCVFSGKTGGYHEYSNHDEINDYGTSKSLGELCDGTIIRTSIIGEELINKRSLLEWVISNENRTINGYSNHFWNGVTCLQLAKIIHKIISENTYWKGVRHIYSPTTVSKYELCKMISDIYELNIKVKEFDTEKVDKSLTTIYQVDIQVPELLDQIKEMREFIFS